ncbi:MAG: NINE protein, partial [Brotaphodocola sp.]
YRRGERTRHPVSKKQYLLLTILTGWIGGHRFYAKRYYLGALYLMFCWTMIPFMMSVLDFLEAVPIKSDEKGIIMM